MEGMKMPLFEVQKRGGLEAAEAGDTAAERGVQ